jgi:hypothetical protein
VLAQLLSERLQVAAVNEPYEYSLDCMNTVLLKLKNVVLYASSFKLRSYEQATLDAWSSHLSASARVLLTAQLRYLISYQRQAGGKSLLFFPLDPKTCTSLPENILFPCKLSDVVVARIYQVGFRNVMDPQATVKAEIQMHKGRITSIEFDKPPQKVLEEGTNVTKVEILRDPMVSISDEDAIDLRRLEEMIESIQSKLPDEYLKLIGNSKGITVNQWAVCGPSKIRRIPQRDGNYYLFAERVGMGAVGVKEDEVSGQLYYLDYGDDRGEKITIAFKDFLEKFDGGRVKGRF